ncbi:MAG: hypothetical protein QW177_10095 [Candidatus Nitrosotenuis sp.]
MQESFIQISGVIDPILQTILFGLFAVTVVFGLQYADAQQAEVPNYLKNKIKLWALDKMTDESFLTHSRP